MSDLVAFSSSSKKDTMYWHQATKQTDASEFRKAVIKEFDSHCQNKHWEIIERSQVPIKKYFACSMGNETKKEFNHQRDYQI